MIAGWLVIPAYNEAAGIAANLDALSTFVAAYGQTTDIEFTLLVVDDGSRDGTREQVEGSVARLMGRGVALRVLSLVRNFGQQAAIIAGLLEAAKAADFVITLDADGEHPHAVIPSLVEEWARGAPIVHTLRRPNLELDFFKRKASAAYYSLIARISSVRIPGWPISNSGTEGCCASWRGFYPAAARPACSPPGWRPTRPRSSTINTWRRTAHPGLLSPKTSRSLSMASFDTRTCPCGCPSS